MEKLNILLVEDDKMCADDLHNRLENLGYHVWNSVSSGTAAIQQAKILHPDLVFIDTDLKGNIDGIEAALQIRNELGIPVVFLISNTHIIHRARTVNPLGYLLKPIDEQKLFITLENVITRTKLEKQLTQTQEMKDIGILANRISHDFFNILCIIRGYTEFSVMTLPEDTKARKSLEKVLMAADRGKDLIEHYLKCLDIYINR